MQKSQFLLGTLVPPNFSKICDFSNFSQFLEKSQFLLDNLLPPVPLDLINLFSLILAKTAISPIFRNFLEKSQKSPFLLGTLVPPLTLDLINFSKNCNFSQFFLLRANLDISHRGQTYLTASHLQFALFLHT